MIKNKKIVKKKKKSTRIEADYEKYVIAKKDDKRDVAGVEAAAIKYGFRRIDNKEEKAIN